MNPRLLMLAAAVLGGVLITPIGYVVGAKLFSTARREFKSDIQMYGGFLRDVHQKREQRKQLDTELASFTDQTLGGKVETTDSRLRERLNKIGEELQIRNLSVSTGRPAPQLSPARGRYTRASERTLRDEPDFVELDGSVTGEATLEQALRLVHRIQSEPWLKRIHQFRLEPRSNGEKFNVTVRLTTLFMPGREPRETPAQPYDGAGFQPYAMLASVNPFRLPTPPAPQPATPASPTPAERPVAPAYAYGQWRVTGVAETSAGVEVWLLNSATQETRHLVIGESLQQAQLVAASPEKAEFRLGEDRFAIAIGKSFDDRMPIKR